MKALTRTCSGAAVAALCLGLGAAPVWADEVSPAPTPMAEGGATAPAPKPTTEPKPTTPAPKPTTPSPEVPTPEPTAKPTAPAPEPTSKPKPTPEPAPSVAPSVPTRGGGGGHTVVPPKRGVSTPKRVTVPQSRNVTVPTTHGPQLAQTGVTSYTVPLVASGAVMALAGAGIAAHAQLRGNGRHKIAKGA